MNRVGSNQQNQSQDGSQNVNLVIPLPKKFALTSSSLNSLSWNRTGNANRNYRVSQSENDSLDENRTDRTSVYSFYKQIDLLINGQLELMKNTEELRRNSDVAVRRLQYDIEMKEKRTNNRLRRLEEFAFGATATISNPTQQLLLANRTRTIIDSPDPQGGQLPFQIESVRTLLADQPERRSEFACEFCGKAFCRQNGVKQHIQLSCREAPLEFQNIDLRRKRAAKEVCSACGRQVNKNYLKIHMDKTCRRRRGQYDPLV